MTLHHDVPDGLFAAGSALWSRVCEAYKLRPDELAILSGACAAEDMVAALSEAWSNDGRPMTTKGSMGQQVIHPLIGEMRAQRAARDAALARLKLPDLDEAAGDVPVPNQQRGAAQSRWAVPNRGA